MTKNTELELRPLGDPELEHVSGGLSGIDALISVNPNEGRQCEQQCLKDAIKQTGSH